MFARLCVFPPGSDCLYSPPSWSPHMWADISPHRMWEAAAPGSWSPQWGSPGTCVHVEVTAPLASADGDVDTRHAGWNNPPQRATAGSAVPTASVRSSPDYRGKRAEGVCSSGPPWCCCCSECSIAGLHHTGSLHSSAQPHRRNSLTRTQHSAMSSLSCFYQCGPMKELSVAVCCSPTENIIQDIFSVPTFSYRTQSRTSPHQLFEDVSSAALSYSNYWKWKSQINVIKSRLPVAR